MSFLRICVYLSATFVLSAPALAKNETLAERGKRMCEESGIAPEDCTMLPPELRGSGPKAHAAAVTPAPRPLGLNASGPAAFGTGKYGWCRDCTSFLAAAPVTPWADFGGRSFQSQRDEDERQVASVGDASPGGDPSDGGDEDGESDGNDGGGGGGNGDGGTGGGEICD